MISMIQAKAETVEWIQIIPSLLGTLIGGFITLIAIWTKEFIDKRKTVQSWFEQNYIEQGVDRMIAFCELIRFHIITSRANPIRGMDAHTVFPIEAAIRTNVLLRSTDATAVPLVYSELLSQPKAVINELPAPTRDAVYNLIQGVLSHLEELHQELLNIKVRKKSDLYNISRLPKIKSIGDSLKKQSQELTNVEDLKHVFAYQLKHTVESAKGKQSERQVDA